MKTVRLICFGFDSNLLISEQKYTAEELWNYMCGENYESITLKLYLGTPLLWKKPL